MTAGKGEQVVPFRRSDPIYRRHLDVAAIIAILLHGGLLYLILPEFGFRAFEEEKRQIIALHRFIRRLEKKPIPKPEVKKKKKKVVIKPVPDPTPDQPEEVSEPEIELDLPEIPEDALVLFGADPVAPVAAVPEGPVELGEGIRPPILIKRVKPEYPRLARKAGIQGVVMLQVVVDKKGAISDVQVVRSMGETGMDEAAIDAVKQWRYKPALMNGQPVSVFIPITIVFRLQ